MYQLASGHAEYDKLKEFQFYYEICARYAPNFDQGYAYTHGFGDRVLGRSDFRPFLQPGIIDVDFSPLPRKPASKTHFVRHYITLTDNSSFVFFNICWMKLKQRGWGVLSTTKNLDVETQKMIEDHATNLGFDGKRMIFFRRETCRDFKNITGKLKT